VVLQHYTFILNSVNIADLTELVSFLSGHWTQDKIIHEAPPECRNMRKEDYSFDICVVGPTNN